MRLRGLGRLRFDVVAGLSVAMVGIPQSLAYAELAGMPPIAGLCAGALPPIVAAVFASSPYLQTGPAAITALLTFGALSTIAAPASPEYVALGLALALVVGVVRVGLGLLRAGWISYLMSQPMLLGFVPAAAILIASSQLGKAVGAAAPESGNPIAAAAWVLVHPDRWSLAALAMTVGTALLIVGGRRLHPLFPGVLAAVALGIAVSALGFYPAAVVAEVPSGFVPFTLVDVPWARIPEVLLPGAVIALVGFTEASSVARRFAAEDRVGWDANREFISQGAANLTAAAFGGVPCGASLSRSSVNRVAGARSRWSGAITGMAVLAFLPFAAVLEPLPLAVLGAIVITALAGLMRFGPLIGIWRLSRPQAIIAWTTFLATLLLAPRIDLAVLVGIGLSIAVFLWRSTQLEIDVNAQDQTLTVVPRGVLWFATAQKLDVVVQDAIAEHPEADRLVVDLGGLGRIDTTGALVLRSLLDRVRTGGISADVCRVPQQSRALTERILGPEDPLRGGLA